MISELDHHFDGFTRVHGAVPIGDTVDVRNPIEHETWLDAPLEHVWQQVRHVGANRRWTAGYRNVGVERWLRIRNRCLLRNSDAADGPAGADPIAFRMKLLTASGTDDSGFKRARSIAVLKAVAEAYGWDTRVSPKPARTGDILTGRGVAYTYRNQTVVAQVASERRSSAACCTR